VFSNRLDLLSLSLLLTLHLLELFFAFSNRLDLLSFSLLSTALTLLRGLLLQSQVFRRVLALTVSGSAFAAGCPDDGL